MALLSRPRALIVVGVALLGTIVVAMAPTIGGAGGPREMSATALVTVTDADFNPARTHRIVSALVPLGPDVSGAVPSANAAQVQIARRPVAGTRIIAITATGDDRSSVRSAANEDARRVVALLNERASGLGEFTQLAETAEPVTSRGRRSAPVVVLHLLIAFGCAALLAYLLWRESGRRVVEIES